MVLPSGHSDPKESVSVNVQKFRGDEARLKLSGSGDGEKLIRIPNAERVRFENKRVGSAAGVAEPAAGSAEAAAGSGSGVGSGCG